MTSVSDGLSEPLVLNSLREPVFVVDSSGTIVYANERLDDVTATSQNSLEDSPVTRLAEYVDVGFDTLRGNIDDVLDGAVDEHRVELRMSHPEPAPVAPTIHAEARITPLTEEGRLIGALVVLWDISAHKETETALKANERRFRKLFESHSAPMLLIDPNTGQIIEANPAASEFYGYSVQTLTDMRIQEINCLSPEAVARKRKRAERENRNHFEFDHELASGEVRTVEVHSTPLEIDGEQLLFSIIHDITERKEYEHELEMYREAVLHTGHSILITDREGNIEYVNPAFEADTGYSSEEAVGETPAILKSDKQDKAFYEQLWETILAGEVWEAELVNRRKSGELYYVEQTIAPITDADGEITNFVGVQSDITERKLREKRLADLNRILRHNLRNALTAIEGFARTLAEDVDEEHLPKLERILSQAEKLADTSDKITTVRQSLDDQYEIGATCNLETVLSEVVAEFEEKYPEAVIAVDAEPVDLDLDAGTCWTLLAELVDNAIAHNDLETPRVTVTVDVPSESSKPVTVQVADNGPGVPEVERTAIEVGADDPLSHSSGIGLAHVHWLVINYGGDVTIRDNEPRGTVVTLSLPPGGNSLP